MSHATSSIIQAGTPAPSFLLPDASGTNWTFQECAGGVGTIVVFACNHCPFVNHIASALGRFEADLQDQGIGIVAISSSDLSLYPEDGPEHFSENATEWDWHFPYLWDQTQRIAHVFGAICTPEFFLYDANDALYYHGRFDHSIPGHDRPSGCDLAHAVDRLTCGHPAPDAVTVHPATGSSIKWVPEPELRWPYEERARA